MGQRINIQYSVEIDDLHKEVQRLMGNASEAIKSLSCDVPSGEDVLSLEAIESIDLLRQELAKIDHTLNDVMTIVSAYVAYSAEMSMQKTMAPTPPQNQEVMNEISAQEQD